MHIAPEFTLELQGRDNLAGARHQQPQRRQLLGRQVNHRFAAPQRPISLQPEAGKAKGWGSSLPAGVCR